MIQQEIESTKHNLSEAMKLPTFKKNTAYINKQIKELARLSTELSKFNSFIDKNITFENSHLFVEYLLKSNSSVMEAIVNEYNAQIRFGDKNESK